MSPAEISSLVQDHHACQLDGSLQCSAAQMGLFWGRRPLWCPAWKIQDVAHSMGQAEEEANYYKRLPFKVWDMTERRKIGFSWIMTLFDQVIHRIKNQHPFKDLHQIISDFLKMLLVLSLTKCYWIFWQGLDLDTAIHHIDMWCLGPGQLKSVIVLLCISAEEKLALYNINSVKGD